MNILAASGINSQVIVISTLVLIVAILLIVIIFLDKKEKLKRNTDEETDYDENFSFEDLYQKNTETEQQNIDENQVLKEETKEEVKEEQKQEVIEQPIEIKEEKVKNIGKDQFNPFFVNKIENKEVKIPEFNKVELLDTKEDHIEIQEENKEEVEDLYQDEELEKTQAQLELKRLTEELEKANDEDVEDNIKLTNFEIDQEENAIISLEELNKISENLYNENEKVQYEDEGNEPITIEQLQEKFNKEIEPEKEQYKQVTLDDFIEPEKTKVQEVIDNATFKKSPIISPVYGIEQSNTKKIIDEEKTKEANKDDLEEELKKTNEFLQTLKELRKNLN